MRRVILVALLAACGHDGDRVCGAGSCTDPAFPYCDVDGTLAGRPHTCIPVACTPGEVAACRGDTAVVCTADGTSFDDIACRNGCEPALPGGCRLCDPNRTVCANDVVETCDNAGDVVAVASCPLGCNATVPRCNDIDPSNELGRYFDEVSRLEDFVLADAVFAADGTVTANGGQTIAIPTFMFPMRVFVVGSLALTNARFGTDGGDAVPFAIVSRGPITIAGTLVVGPTAGSTDCRPGPGLVTASASSGGGGGANATDGGSGGAVTGALAGGVADLASGAAELVPLTGGCSGAIAGTPVVNGGGALQLASSAKIAITATVVDLRGRAGTAQVDITGGLAVGGGGAGGSLLLEAAEVELGPNTGLLLSGGNGFHCANAGCGDAGTGATRTTPATAGGSVPAVMNATGGGGGGGLGRVRINTKTGAYTKAATTVEDAAVTTGTIRTR